MPSKPRYFTYSSMAFFPLLSIRCLYSGNWYYFCKTRHQVVNGVGILQFYQLLTLLFLLEIYS
ncbi:hypothetical protein [Wolbachia endosymbiont (group B) of Gerris lacustris]|uniref:hypothetical protein n=1 Tax=Wolbachia endosymbiont (group B) of Gerris lacustris TaxID=3066159 RepID=UPI00333FA4CA